MGTSHNFAASEISEGNSNHWKGNCLQQISLSTGHTLNGQPLLEFAHPHDLGGGAGTELRVKAATLWVRVDFRSPLHRAFRHNVPDKNLTLWIFTVTQHLQTNTTHLSGKVCCCSVTISFQFSVNAVAVAVAVAIALCNVA